MRVVSLGLAFWLSLLACQQPPPGQVYGRDEAKVGEPQPDREFTAAAHHEAYAELETDAIEPLRRADPIAAAQIGRGSPGITPLALVDRNALLDALAPVWKRVGEIDETALPPGEVVALRTIRFGLSRVHDELHRRPQLRTDPLTSMRALERLVDEIELRSLTATCTDCAGALVNLDDTLNSAHQQLGASSQASAALAKARASQLAARLRGLAQPERAATLGLDPATYERAAAALDAHALRLDALVLHLPSATALAWSTQAPPVVGGLESVQRLPAVLGERTLTRVLSAEERLDIPAAKLWAQVKQHVTRWQRMREQLVEPTLAPEAAAAPLDLARCEAARSRLAAAIANIPDLAAPTQLDCTRFVALHGDAALRDSQLVLALLDAGWIEPARREIRRQELPAIALIEGQWSPSVHRHLRRVMVLAATHSEPHALALALDEGRRALCLAGAALWIHAELGPVDETLLMQGPACEGLLPAASSELLALVHGDPRSALAGLGLSLIGDEPAAMAGFDRFWWAPLGLMRLLATPAGMHPDAFELPSEQADAGEVEVKIEQLDPMELPDE